MLNERLHAFLELWQPGFSRERFVVAVEREDHVGLGVRQLEAVFAVLAFVALAELVRLRAWPIAGEPFVLRAEIPRPQPMVGILPTVDFIANPPEYASFVQTTKL